MIAHQQYVDAVEQFAKTCATLGDRLVMAFVFGSIARGEVQPGKSDILDAIVILEDSVFVEKDKFCETLATLVRACEELNQSGLPFHPFMYYSYTEFRHNFYNFFSPMLTSDRYSRVLLGHDIRVEHGSSDRDNLLTSISFFSCRRHMQRLSQLADLSSIDNLTAQLAIDWFLKHMFTAAANLCGQKVFYPDSIRAVQNLFPELNLDHLESLISFTKSESFSTPVGSQLIQYALTIIEELNNLLISYLHSTDQWFKFQVLWEAEIIA
jgi:predicted nucleotidyltransferase